MKKKKREIILLGEVVTLDKFNELVKENIFPLTIFLNDEETKEFNNIDEMESEKTEKFRFLLGDDDDCFYNSLRVPELTGEEYIYFNSYVLRRKIENGEVYVNKYLTSLDKKHNVKNVKFIEPAFRYDLDSPRIVFSKMPRIFFKKQDHFTLSKYQKGEQISTISHNLAFDHIRELSKRK